MSGEHDKLMTITGTYNDVEYAFSFTRDETGEIHFHNENNTSIGTDADAMIHPPTLWVSPDVEVDNELIIQLIEECRLYHLRQMIETINDTDITIRDEGNTVVVESMMESYRQFLVILFAIKEHYPATDDVDRSDSDVNVGQTAIHWYSHPDIPVKLVDITMHHHELLFDPWDDYNQPYTNTYLMTQDNQYYHLDDGTIERVMDDETINRLLESNQQECSRYTIKKMGCQIEVKKGQEATLSITKDIKEIIDGLLYGWD